MIGKKNQKQKQKQKIPGSETIKKEYSQAILFMGLKNPKLNISKANPIFYLLLW